MPITIILKLTTHLKLTARSDAIETQLFARHPHATETVLHKQFAQSFEVVARKRCNCGVLIKLYIWTWDPTTAMRTSDGNRQSESWNAIWQLNELRCLQSLLRHSYKYYVQQNCDGKTIVVTRSPKSTGMCLCAKSVVAEKLHLFSVDLRFFKSGQEGILEDLSCL